MNGRHIGKSAEQMDIDVNVTTVIMVGNANSVLAIQTERVVIQLEQKDASQLICARIVSAVIQWQ